MHRDQRDTQRATPYRHSRPPSLRLIARTRWQKNEQRLTQLAHNRLRGAERSHSRRFDRRPCCTSSRRRTAAHRKPTHRRKHERPSSFTALTLLKCTDAALTHSSGSRRFHAASHRPFLWPSVPSATATPLLSSQPPRSACVQRISSRWKLLQSCPTTPFAQQSHPATLVSSYSPSRSSTAERCGLDATRMQDALDSLNSEADSCLLELIHLADRRSRLSEVPSWINLFTSSPLSPLLLTSRSLRRLLTAATPTTHSSISLH